MDLNPSLALQNCTVVVSRYSCIEFASVKWFYRLQTGMRGAFGKPQGTVARVRIGQPIMSVRTSDRHRAAVVEALRRAKFKFPGRQKVRHVNLLIVPCSHLASLTQPKETFLHLHNCIAKSRPSEWRRF